MSDRDVTVKLSLVAGDQSGPKALRDTAAAADTAAKNVDRVGKAYRDAASAAGQMGAAADRASRAARDPAAAAAGGPTYSHGGRSYDADSREGKILAGEQDRQANDAARKRLGLGGGDDQGGGRGRGLLGALGAGTEGVQAAIAAGAALALLTKGLNTAAVAVDAFKDSSLSTGAALRKVQESLPIIGELAKAQHQLADALTGFSQTKRDVSRNTALSTGTSTADLAAFHQSLPLHEQAAQLEAMVKARAGNPLSAYNAPDRDSYQGDIDYQNYQRRRPLELEQREAQIGAAAAKDVAGQSAQRQSDLAAELAQKQQASQKAQADLKALLAEQAQGGTYDSSGRQRIKQSSFLPKADTQLHLPGYGDVGKAGDYLPDWSTSGKFKNAVEGHYGTSAADKDKLEAQSKVDLALKDQLKTQQELQAATQQTSKDAAAAVEAESKIRQSNIGVMKEELAVLNEREQRVKGSAQSFGGLDASERFSALQAAKHFHDQGYENLTKDEINLLQGAGAGAVIAKEREKSALGDADFQQFQQLTGQEFDLKGIQQKQIQAAVKLDVAIEFDKTALAQQLKDTIGPLLKEQLKQVKEINAATVELLNTSLDLLNWGQ